MACRWVCSSWPRRARMGCCCSWRPSWKRLNPGSTGCRLTEPYADLETGLGIAQLQPAAMRLGHQPAQAQPQTHTAFDARACGIGPVEGLAQLRQRFRRYTSAVIAHREADALA